MKNKRREFLMNVCPSVAMAFMGVSLLESCSSGGEDEVDNGGGSNNQGYTVSGNTIVITLSHSTFSTLNSNGWMNFSAKNFEFSTPKLMLKLTQNSPTEQVQTPAPKSSATAAAPATKPVAKTISITCSKGKVKRKVTGAPPRCPAGYRKG